MGYQNKRTQVNECRIHWDTHNLAVMMKIYMFHNWAYLSTRSFDGNYLATWKMNSRLEVRMTVHDIMPKLKLVQHQGALIKPNSMGIKEKKPLLF